MTIRCAGCGGVLPIEALNWPSGTEYCTARCGGRFGVSDAILKVLREREAPAAAQ